MVETTNTQTTTLAGGCFWCLEAAFEQLDGVVSVLPGYMGGQDPRPTYEAVCRGDTGHAEVVQITFDPAKVSYAQLVEHFWRTIDPFDANGQFCDKGNQYRSAIFASNDEQLEAAKASREGYARMLAQHGYGAITTEIRAAPDFYYAEGYHQQYLAKNPGGYCGLGGTGVSCPAELVRASA